MSSVHGDWLWPGARGDHLGYSSQVRVPGVASDEVLQDRLVKAVVGATYAYASAFSTL